MKTEREPRFRLYTYWRSSAAYRVRIALNLKGLSYESIPVHLVKQGGEQLREDYRKVNPQGLVPVLEHVGRILTQSMAICEYLDECYDGYPLLPSDPLARARVRSLALQVACEIHPLNNLRVQKYLTANCGHSLDTVDWMKHWMGEGFTAIETTLTREVHPDSGYFAEQPGLFECFLIPQVYNANRFGVDMTAFPTICNMVACCERLDAFRLASPQQQADAEEV
jgi:maleylacetoacetate isomerase/maleylpyruvate isomerase